MKECSKLRALRICNPNPIVNGGQFPASLVEKAEAIPPKLQYIVWENGTFAQTYELSADCEGRKVTKIPRLRPTPSKGKWSADWYEESVFDHIVENYDEE